VRARVRPRSHPELHQRPVRRRASREPPQLCSTPTSKTPCLSTLCRGDSWWNSLRALILFLLFGQPASMIPGKRTGPLVSPHVICGAPEPESLPPSSWRDAVQDVSGSSVSPESNTNQAYPQPTRTGSASHGAPNHKDNRLWQDRLVGRVGPLNRPLVRVSRCGAEILGGVRDQTGWGYSRNVPKPGRQSKLGMGE